MSLCVLIADENPASKQVFHLTLEGMSVDVKSVHSGDEVFECVKNFNPHVVFLDLLLPKKNGYEVCKELKHHFKHLPVILMWTSFMKLNREKFQQCGACDHLKKPFDIGQVREMILKHTEASLDTNPALEHMIFPDMPEIEEDEKEWNELSSENKKDESVSQKKEDDSEVKARENNKEAQSPLGGDLGALDHWFDHPSLENIESSQKKPDLALRPERQVLKGKDQNIASSLSETKGMKDMEKAIGNVTKNIDGFKELSLDQKQTQGVKTLSQDEKKNFKKEMMEEAIRQEILQLAQKELKVFMREILPKVAVRVLKDELEKLLGEKNKGKL